MRIPRLLNTRRPFYSMRWRNTALNIDVLWSFNMTAYRTTICSPPQWLLDLLHLLMIHKLCPTVMKNTEWLTVWPERHRNEAIMQLSNWQPQGSISTHLPNNNRTGDKFIRLWMISTATQWRLVGHFGYWISRTGGGNKMQCT
jgi:hypothetical protein